MGRLDLLVEVAKQQGIDSAAIAWKKAAQQHLPGKVESQSYPAFHRPARVLGHNLALKPPISNTSTVYRNHPVYLN